MKKWGCLAVLATTKPPKPGPFGHTQADREQARFLISSGRIRFCADTDRYLKWRRHNPGKTGADYEALGLARNAVIVT